MANTLGHTKKVTMNALWFIAYSLGNILGPQAFTSRDAPTYTGGFIGLLVSIGVATASISVYGLFCKRENVSRDSRGLGTDDRDNQDEAFTDMTDKEKLSFKYTY
ncbi:hypothetical protein Neosp_013564 [[Neocosmospora] mangrovei]